MQMKLVKSSHIYAVGYDDKEQRLFIRYRTGKTYSFDKVPATRYAEMLKATSVGKYLHQHITKQYQGQRVPDNDDT